jgi:hypothetical protein
MAYRFFELFEKDLTGGKHQFATAGKKIWTRSAAIRGLVLVIVSAGIQAQAAKTWYVDSGATGSHNGSSWTDAWTSLSQISGVAAGDTVNISGGPSGSTRSYSMNGSFPIVNGTASARTIYQIGQDSSHNGTALINLNGGHLLTEVNNVTFTGDAGDGKMHIVLSRCDESVSIYAANGLNFKLSYVDLGASTVGMNVNVMRNAEIDHCKFFKLSDLSSSQYTHILGFQAYVSPSWVATGYGSNSFHHNLIYLPRDGQSSPGGDDCLNSGNGLDFYNNAIVAYFTNGYPSNLQHQDGIQWEWGGYLRAYNNIFVNMANSALYVEGAVGDIAHVKFYNNLIIGDNSSICGSPERGVDINAGSTPTFTDMVVANNLFADLGNSAHPAAWSIRIGDDSATYQNVVAANNVSINSSGLGGYSGGAANGNWAADNLGPLAWVNGSGHVVSYSTFAGTNNNFHLIAADTTFRGHGTNMTAFGITTDMDGNARPATGSWDIGPYQFGATNGNQTLTANAGPDQSITLPANSVTLNGSFVNTLGGTIGLAWSKVSGPGTVSFSAASSATTTATFSAAGTYVLRLTATVLATSISDDVTVTVNSQPQAGMSFEAESGTITAPFVVSGTYISQSVETGLAGGGRAVYSFSVPSNGTYVVTASVSAPSVGENSIYVNVDADPVDPTMIWDVAVTSGFETRTVSWRGTGTDVANEFNPKLFTLNAGAHSLVIIGREANVGLDSMQIQSVPTAPPLPPTNLQVILP